MNNKCCYDCRWYMKKGSRCFNGDSDNASKFITDIFGTSCDCYESNNSIERNKWFEKIGTLASIKDYCKLHINCKFCGLSSKTGCLFNETNPEYWDLEGLVKTLSKEEKDGTHRVETFGLEEV